jgi:hypothetical protein
MNDLTAPYWPKFNDAFMTSSSSPDPHEIADKLKLIIKNHASWACIAALTQYIIKISNVHPLNVAFYCEILVHLVNQDDVWRLTISKPKVWGGADHDTFGIAFSASFREAIDDGLEDAYADDDLGNLAVTPSNIRLTTALLSASTIKSGLRTMPKVAFMNTKIGLEDPALQPEPEKAEIYAIAACLHLVITGSKMMQQSLFVPEQQADVIDKLKVLKEQEVLKLPSAVHLLEVSLCPCILLPDAHRFPHWVQYTIGNVNKEYTAELTEREAWQLLFPPQSSIILQKMSELFRIVREHIYL